MRLHLHWPRVSQTGRIHTFQICRCSARRTRRNQGPLGYAPIPKGWPKPREGWV